MRALVTGGASCGKSRYAESLCQSLGGTLVYLAAMQPFGEEGQARIRRHRALRAGKGFSTVECFEGLKVSLDDSRTLGATALLEDLGNVVANRLFAGAMPCTTDAIVNEIVSELDALAQRCAHLVVVGNEVGGDGATYGRETEDYRVILGQVARAWATRCDFVAGCTAGVPTILKGEGKHESVA